MSNDLPRSQRSHPSARRVVAGLTLAVVAGCGSDGGDASVIGSVGGTSLDGDLITIGVERAPNTPLNDGAVPVTEIYLGISDAFANFCPDIGRRSGGVSLLLEVHAAALAPGSYAACSGFDCAPPFASAVFYDDDPFGVDATSGTIEILEAGDVVSGTFDLTFGDDHLTGEFSSAIDCTDTRPR
ncbi:MAG: hypothetical protein R2939_01925 [Kofleriaceae bacterium]